MRFLAVRDAVPLPNVPQEVPTLPVRFTAPFPGTRLLTPVPLFNEFAPGTRMPIIQEHAEKLKGNTKIGEEDEEEEQWE